MRSAPVFAFALRRLGATVGNNLQCAHDAEFSGPLDLLTIGNDVAIQTGAYVHLVTWEGQSLHIGLIHLEDQCKVGMRAGIGNNVTVGRGAHIYPFTPVLHDIGANEMWEGAPAQSRGLCTQLNRTKQMCRHQKPIWVLETLNVLMQTAFELMLVIVPTAFVSWMAVKFIPASNTEIAEQYFSMTPLHDVIWQFAVYAFITAWVSVVFVSVLGSIFLRLSAMSPGMYPTRGLKGALLLYRVKKMNQIQRQWTWTLTGQYLRALAGVRFARLGASECDVMFNLVPDTSTAGAQVFWSNGCFTNMLDYGAEHLKLRQLDMARNFFTGNNCVAEAGHFPSNFLIGVSTMANDIQFRRQMFSQAGEPVTVVGSPPIKVPRAESEPEKPPTFSLFLVRVLLNDIFSIGFLPIANVIAYVLVFTALMRWEVHPVAGAFIALAIAEFILIFLCVVIKMVFVGRTWGVDHSAPFWSWRHFAYFFAQDCFYAWCRIPLGISSGTVLSNTVLRWMGCKIGARTIVASPMQASDFNAVNFGDDCIVAGFLQYHTLEGMMLKVKRTHIKDRSSINFGATLMGGGTIEPDTTLLPLSMSLKEMYLPTAVYEGSPVEPVTPAGRLSISSEMQGTQEMSNDSSRKAVVELET